MSDEEGEAPSSNRDRKVESRQRRKRYVQGTRAYLHALTNSVARRTPGPAPRDRAGEDADESGRRSK